MGGASLIKPDPWGVVLFAEVMGSIALWRSNQWLPGRGWVCNASATSKAALSIAGSSTSDARSPKFIENSVLERIGHKHARQKPKGLGVVSVYSAHDGRWLVGLGVEFPTGALQPKSHCFSLVRLMSF